MFERLLLAFSVGVGLFLALLVFAYPMGAQGEGFQWIALVGIGGAAAAGFAVVLIAGDRRAMWMSGLLCSFTGAILYTIALVPTIFADSLELSQGLLQALLFGLISFLQFAPFATAGAFLGRLALGWTGSDSRRILR